MAGQVSKNVSLTPELDAYIGAEVASGRFQNASEVVRAALRLMADHEVRLVRRARSREGKIHDLSQLAVDAL